MASIRVIFGQKATNRKLIIIRFQHDMSLDAASEACGCYFEEDDASK